MDDKIKPIKSFNYPVPQVIKKDESSVRVNLDTPADSVELSSSKPKQLQARDLPALSFGELAKLLLKTMLEPRAGMPKIDNSMSLEDVQTHFRDIFMNDKLSLGETKVMLDRYKELDKIENDEDYAKAVYEEAKRNFGLENLNCDFSVKDVISERDGFFIKGTTDPLGCITVAMKYADRNSLFNTIHHELRHLKQKYYEFNYSPEEYVNRNQPKNMTLDKQVFSAFLGGEPDKRKIPQAYLGFTKKCLVSERNYVAAGKDRTRNKSKHFDQFVETDARSVGDRMEKIIRIVRTKD